MRSASPASACRAAAQSGIARTLEARPASPPAHPGSSAAARRWRALPARPEWIPPVRSSRRGSGTCSLMSSSRPPLVRRGLGGSTSLTLPYPFETCLRLISVPPTPSLHKGLAGGNVGRLLPRANLGPLAAARRRDFLIRRGINARSSGARRLVRRRTNTAAGAGGGATWTESRRVPVCAPSASLCALPTRSCRPSAEPLGAASVTRSCPPPRHASLSRRPGPAPPRAAPPTSPRGRDGSRGVRGGGGRGAGGSGSVGTARHPGPGW